MYKLQRHAGRAPGPQWGTSAPRGAARHMPQTRAARGAPATASSSSAPCSGMGACVPRSQEKMDATSSRLLAPGAVERRRSRVRISVPAALHSGRLVNRRSRCAHAGQAARPSRRRPRRCQATPPGSAAPRDRRGNKLADRLARADRAWAPLTPASWPLARPAPSPATKR